MRKYGYLVVEGPHDVEFAYRLLSPYGMKRIQCKNEVDAFFHSLIPVRFPLEDGDIQKRVPIPLFLQSETHAIAIRSAMGDSQLVNVMVSSTALLTDLNEYVGVGILLDSDRQNPVDRYAAIKRELLEKSQQFKLHDELGQVNRGQPNLGAFVLPDNATLGTLEDLLLKCAEVVYPNLLEIAQNYVDAAKNTNLNREELKEIEKPAGRNKAIVGAMATIMKPGKSVQASIQDNGWLKGEALSLSRIKSVQEFLQILFELPVESTQQLN
jgi:hypothetical protein